MATIVVLNYNNHQETSDFVKAIVQHQSLKHVVVVDNCSTDGSYKELLGLSKYPKVDVIKTIANGGYSSGNNSGVWHALKTYGSEVVIISNPDIEVCDSTISALISEIKSASDIGLVTGLVHDPSGKVISNFAWKVPTYFDIIVNQFRVISKVMRAVSNRSIYFNYDAESDGIKLEVGAVSGCFFAIKSSVFEQMRGFDERVFLYGEENILGYRLRELGFRSIVLLDKNVVHFGSVFRKSSWRSKIIGNKCLLDSMKIYLKEYLGVSRLQMLFFLTIFWPAKLENYLYDLLAYLQNRFIKGK